METIIREYDIKKMKAEIKSLAKNQTVLKDQRKTDKNKLARTISPKDATWKHKNNREILSAMYVAYGIMRGKDLEEELKNHVSKKDPYAMNRARKDVENFLVEYEIIIDEIEVPHEV